MLRNLSQEESETIYETASEGYPETEVDFGSEAITFRSVVLNCLRDICPDYDLVPSINEYYDMPRIECLEPSEEEYFNTPLSILKKRIIEKRRQNSQAIKSVLKKGMCVVYANPQAGKSSFIKTRAVYSLLEGFTVFIILRNLKGDSNQLENYINEVFSIIENKLDENGIYDRPFQFSLIRGEKLQNEKNKNIINQSLNSGYPRIFLCLGNDAQLSRLIAATQSKSDYKYILFIDEIDYVDYGKNTSNELCSTAKSLQILKQRAYQTFGISATPLDCIFSEEELKRTNCFNLTPKPDYRGFIDILVKPLEIQTEVFALNKEASYAELQSNDKNFSPFLQWFSETKPELTIKYNEKIPNICLIKNTRFIKNQFALAEGINREYPTQFATVVYNGAGSLIYFHDMPDEIIVSNKSVEQGEFAPIDIADCLQYFYDNGGVEKFPRIIVIAGELAGRSISYVTKNFKWHTTDMYYIPAQTTTIPDMIQSAGRLCGTNKGLSHLHLHTTHKVAKALFDGFNFTDEVLLRAMMSPLIEDNTTFADSILKVKMNKMKMPTGRNLTSKVKLNKSKFNLVSDNDDGRDLSSYIYKKVIDQAIQVARERIQREEQLALTREIPETEYYRLTQTIFPKWSQSETKIALFMKGLDPNKIYSKIEMRDFSKSVGVNQIIQLTKNTIGTSHGYGMILKKVDNTYMLYPELREAFNKYF